LEDVLEDNLLFSRVVLKESLHHLIKPSDVKESEQARQSEQSEELGEQGLCLEESVKGEQRENVNEEPPSIVDQYI
jgi:hypothetical protein